MTGRSPAGTSCSPQDTGGDDFHVYAVDIETREQRDLTPFDNVTAGLAARRDETGPGSRPGERPVPELHDIIAVNIVTGIGTDWSRTLVLPR